MQERSNRFMKTGLFTLLVLGSAVAAFGLTFHFFGQSEIVPAPSKQFGFFALAPLGIIDKIYFWYSHERLYWHPIPIHVIPYMPKASKLKRNIESLSRY